MRRGRVVAVVLIAGCLLGAGCKRHHRRASASSATLLGHRVVLDPQRNILPWSRADSPYAHVAGLAWDALLTRFPPQENGKPAFYLSSRFDPVSFGAVNWPHNPAGLNAMLVDSALLHYSFTGDRRAIELARGTVDHQLARGTTPEGWLWARVPFASAAPGSLDYGGADDAWCKACGRGDGVDVIEPDKVGELGYAYARLFEHTGDVRYRAAAVACGDALAKHVRSGDARRSPWPFRVNAKTGAVREEYSAHVLGPVMLFEELEHLGAGDVAAYRRARDLAWGWMMEHPMKTDHWSGYFEDIEIQPGPGDNPNQYAPLQTARYLLEHPERDPDWRGHVDHLLDWVARTFAGDTAAEKGTQYGAEVLSEQRADMAKMGSHTARWGAVNALYFERTGELPRKDRARRSLAWATYVCDPRGVVVVGEDKNEGYWFSDGYGDYIRHFYLAMASVPEWAPARSPHLLRSSSTVKEVSYAPREVRWTTFDAAGGALLRVPAGDASVRATAGGVPLGPDALHVERLGRTWVVRVEHTRPDVVLTF